MNKYVLNTISEDSIYTSLAEILNVSKDNVREFFESNLEKFLGLEYYQIDLKPFYNKFDINKDDFYFEYVLIHHVTTRLLEDDITKSFNIDDIKKSFSIDNLENVLLSNNTLTRFFRENKIEFLKEEGIAVYYNEERARFTEDSLKRLKARLDNLNDSCVNGFLFSKDMDKSYEHLTAMPEIVSDILFGLDRTDLQEQYCKNCHCFVASIEVKIDDFILDNCCKLKSKTEKSELILKYVLNYLCFKCTNDPYYFFENPIIRLPDNKNVTNHEIFELRKISNCNEIFI